jgi:hypothetical protein
MKISRAQVTFDREQDAVGIHMTLSEAKRIRAALSDLDDDEDLRNYGGILEILRKAIPQQFGKV